MPNLRLSIAFFKLGGKYEYVDLYLNELLLISFDSCDSRYSSEPFQTNCALWVLKKILE